MGKQKTVICAAPDCKKKIGRHDAARVHVKVDGPYQGEYVTVIYHLECAQRWNVG